MWMEGRVKRCASTNTDIITLKMKSSGIPWVPWAQTCAEHHESRHLLHSWLSSLVWEAQSSAQTLQPG